MRLNRSLLHTHLCGYQERYSKPSCLPFVVVAVILSIIIWSGFDDTVVKSATTKVTADVATSTPVILKKKLNKVHVFVTTYNDYGRMANGKITHEGAAACSRKWRLGTKFTLDGITYTCEDRYNARLEDMRSLPTVDIWHNWSYYKAKEFGIRQEEIIIHNQR